MLFEIDPQPLAEELTALGGVPLVVRAYDPQAMEKAKAQLPRIACCRDLNEAARGADALLLLTEWEEFRVVDWERVRGLVARPVAPQRPKSPFAGRVGLARFSIHQVGSKCERLDGGSAGGF